MKKNYVLVWMIFSLCFLYGAFYCSCFAQTRSEKIYEDTKYCYDNKNSSSCYKDILDKYKENYSRFYYARALMNEKSYSKAKEEFEIYLQNEKTNETLITQAKSHLQKINKILSATKTAKNLDSGDYFNKLKSYAKWQKPYNIKVYIKGYGQKLAILKNAFSIWDSRLYSLVDFSYVDNEQDANIICFYVDTPDELNYKTQSANSDAVGLTTYQYDPNFSGVKRIQKATIKISLKSNDRRNFTDKELLSITLHEIGHALGISDHSDNMGDIMYYSTDSYKIYTPSNRDVNTVKKIYRN